MAYSRNIDDRFVRAGMAKGRIISGQSWRSAWLCGRVKDQEPLCIVGYDIQGGDFIGPVVVNIDPGD